MSLLKVESSSVADYGCAVSTSVQRPLWSDLSLTSSPCDSFLTRAGSCLEPRPMLAPPSPLAGLVDGVKERVGRTAEVLRKKASDLPPSSLPDLIIVCPQPLPGFLVAMGCCWDAGFQASSTSRNADGSLPAAAVTDVVGAWEACIVAMMRGSSIGPSAGVTSGLAVLVPPP